MHSSHSTSCSRRRGAGWIGCVIACVVAVACSNERPGDSRQNAIGDVEYDRVAEILGGVLTTSSQGGELGSVGDATSMSLGTPRLALHADGQGNAWVVRDGGLKARYNAQCRDAQDQTIACSDASDRSSVIVHWLGRMTTPFVDVTIEQDSELEGSALQNDIVLVSGDGAFDVRADDLHLQYDVHYEALRVASYSMFVLGGSAHYTIDVEAIGGDGASGSSFQVDAVVRFDEGMYASMTLDETRPYRVDMKTGEVLRPLPVVVD